MSAAMIATRAITRTQSGGVEPARVNPGTTMEPAIDAPTR